MWKPDLNTTLAAMRQKPTDELLHIWTCNDRQTWRDDAFEAIAIVLRERGEALPPQLASQQGPRPKYSTFRRLRRPTEIERMVPADLVAALWSLSSFALHILAVMFFFIALHFTTRISGIEGYIGTVVVFGVTSALGVAAFLLKYRAKSFRALRANAETVRRLDPRPPVLFLRSFQDDYVSPRPSGSEFFHRFGFLLPQTFDEVLADEALQYGPAITAGLPGEELPPPGAARGLLPPDQWRDAVESLADTAALIIVLVGETEGLLWEIKTLVERQILSKVLFVLPPATSDSVPNKDQGARNIAPTRWSSIWSLADNSTWEKLFSMRQSKLEPILMHVHAPGWGYIVLSRSQTGEAYRSLIQAVVPGVLGGWSDSEIRPILDRAGFAVVGFGGIAEFDKGMPLTTDGSAPGVL